MVLAQARNNQASNDRYWLSADILNLPSFVVEEWNNYTLSLLRVGIMLNDQRDCIVWEKNKINGDVIAILAYYSVVED